MSYRKKYLVGNMRPSQLLLTYGVGAIIALPHLSTLVMGLDDWDTRKSEEIVEPRLLLAVQSIMGTQMKKLLSPPASDDSLANPLSLIGVPVAAFPRNMVCPSCRLLASVDDGFFELRANPYHPDKTRYVHHNCGKGKQPTVVPSRFMIACETGHLDDFPWHHFLHGDRPCKAIIHMNELGVSGEPSDIIIVCKTCGTQRPMGNAFMSDDDERTYTPKCSGRMPHLRSYARKACEHAARTILLSASNTWFPLVYSSLSIPEIEDHLGQLVAEYEDFLEGAATIDELRPILHGKRLTEKLGMYSAETIWSKLEERKQPGGTTVGSVIDLKTPEWQIFSNPLNAPHTDDFELVPANLPEGYEQYIQQVVLIERLREVMALTGFTRIESLSDYAEEQELPKDHIMKLAQRAPEWIPATEVRGEGIFIQFREETLKKWLKQKAIERHDASFFEAHKRWRSAHEMEQPEANYPEIRYILLHTFAHALMRQLTLECGYSAASLRERIYAQPHTAEGGAMAGVLIYTAASDSEGTLGGLVSRGKELGFHIGGALDDMEYCASDPLCAEHVRLEDSTLHGAACHACLFIPETSCERGNRYLDRSLLISTVEREDLAFFQKINL